MSQIHSQITLENLKLLEWGEVCQFRGSLKTFLKFGHFKEILLKNGFIEEMKSIWGNKEIPQTFFSKIPFIRERAI